MSNNIAGNNLWLPIALSLVAFGSFSWALRWHFETGGRIPIGMRLLSLFSLLSYATYVAFLCGRGCEVTVWTTLGLVGFALSIPLFWWTVMATKRHRLCVAYTDAEPHVICTGGPYAHVRHPFYLSYITFWIGTALVVGWWQWAVALILTLWYIRIAQGEERRFQSSALSTGYGIYREQIGMLLPRLVPSRR
jgi:protein-S-isoprenylcysteine O-methyltransferase Ste14